MISNVSPIESFNYHRDERLTLRIDMISFCFWQKALYILLIVDR